MLPQIIIASSCILITFLEYIKNRVLFNLGYFIYGFSGVFRDRFYIENEAAIHIATAALDSVFIGDPKQMIMEVS